jgi:hypothetical protein
LEPHDLEFLGSGVYPHAPFDKHGRCICWHRTRQHAATALTSESHASM